MLATVKTAKDLPSPGPVVAQVPELPDLDLIFGRTEVMEGVRANLLKVSRTDVPVLITGESGTGKQVIAQLLHAHSHLSANPFVQINCAAVPPTLIESELFGSEKGAFTGANVAKPGRVDLAHSGTLFLDEISEIGPGVQAKLLHLLQDGRFSRVGGQEEEQAMVRFILASNRDLEYEIEEGNFREDLYYRINVVNLALPPLRERRDDIPILSSHFLAKFNEKFERQAPPISKRCLQRMCEYDWPGNIRQLENLIKRYVVLGSEEAMVSEMNELAPEIVKFVMPSNGQVSLKEIKRRATRQLERKIILKIVEACGWNRKRAAERLNISYRALLYKLKEVGVPLEHQRAGGKTVKKDSAQRHADGASPTEGDKG